MKKSGLAGLLALTLAAFGATPAAAGGCCDCYPSYGYGYGYYGYSAYVPGPRVYAYDPRVLYYRFDPRWQYSAAYYNSPGVYGYAYVNRGPAYPVYRVRPRGWYGRW